MEIFYRPGVITRFHDKKNGPALSYAEIVSTIPHLLRRLNAARLCILKLGFSAPDINQASDAFLEHLNAIREVMEEMILGSRFPTLKAIIFDLGLTRDIPLWQSRISECFPKLKEVVSIQVIPHDSIRFVTHIAINRDFQCHSRTSSEDIRSDGRAEFYY